MTRRVPTWLPVAAGGLLLVVSILLAGRVLDDMFLQADMRRDADHYRQAAESERALLLAIHKQPLRALARGRDMKSDTSFIYGTLEVSVDRTWTRVTAIGW